MPAKLPADSIHYGGVGARGWPLAVDLYITENGVAFEDRSEADGRVLGPRRVAFSEQHLQQAAGGIVADVPLRFTLVELP